jgi:hypothetical protein
VVRLRLLADQTGLQLGQVVEQMVGNAADGLVWGVDAVVDTCGLPVPGRPGLRDGQEAVHHGGDQLGRVTIVGGRAVVFGVQDSRCRSEGVVTPGPDTRRSAERR